MYSTKTLLYTTLLQKSTDCTKIRMVDPFYVKMIKYCTLL